VLFRSRKPPPLAIKNVIDRRPSSIDFKNVKDQQAIYQRSGSLSFEHVLDQRAPLLSLYPLHREKEMSYFRNHWLKTFKLSWFFPLSNAAQRHDMNAFFSEKNGLYFNIKEYFGEKIGLYFVFSSFMISWMVVPAVVGLACQIIVWVSDDYSHLVLPFYAILILVWSVFALKNWSRLENRLKMHWGTYDFEDEEIQRPQFKYEFKLRKGKLDSSNDDEVEAKTTNVPDPIRKFEKSIQKSTKNLSHLILSSKKNTKKIIENVPALSFPSRQQRKMRCLSFTVVVFLCILNIGVVAMIYILHYLRVIDKFANFFLNISAIQIFRQLATSVVYKLIDMENHRTATQYEDALMGKVFCFQVWVYVT